MIKRLTLVLALAFVVCMAFSAYAEVQNVKLSGDLTAYAVARNAYDLGGASAASTTTGKDVNTGFISIARVKVDADLTDNVVATVRLLNERPWGSLDENTTNTNIDLDLAYVTIKEFLDPHATLLVGRQCFCLASGLLVGNPYTNRLLSSGSALPTGFGDLSVRKAFDSIIGVLDYSPLKVNVGYAKGFTGVFNVLGPQVDVYIADVDYDFGVRGTKASGFYVLKNAKKAPINNFGFHVDSTPIDNLKTSAEFVTQLKKGIRADGGNATNDALLLNAEYTLAKVAMTPTFGLDYTYLSRNWDVMFEDITPADITNAIFPNTNMQIFGAKVSAKPMEDVTAKLRFVTLKRNSNGMTVPIWGQTSGNYDMTDKKQLGNELDGSVTYDYTEDVQFGLSAGIFKPGEAFAKTNRKGATQVLGSMKVTF